MGEDDLELKLCVIPCIRKPTRAQTSNDPVV